MKNKYPFIAAHGKHVSRQQTEIDQLTDRAITDNAPADAYDFDQSRGGWLTMTELKTQNPGLVERFEREQGITVDELLTEQVG